jgi:hypothetical protein
MAEFKFDPSLRLNLELHGDTASRETSVCIVDDTGRIVREVKEGGE